MAPGMAKKECHHWRTTGICAFGDKCRYNHTESLRGDRTHTFEKVTTWRQAPQDLTTLPPPKKSSWKVREAIKAQKLLEREEIEPFDMAEMKPFDMASLQLFTEAQKLLEKEEMEPFDMASLQLPTPPGRIITAEALLTTTEFSAMDLIRSIARPLHTSEIIDYVSKWKDHDVREEINSCYDGYSALFYACRTYDCELVRFLIEIGADPSLQAAKQSVPLLAWIILQDDPRSFNIVATLLSMGCSPSTIPPDMYADVMITPALEVLDEEILRKTSPWCTRKLRAILARKLNLTHRYLLNKAASKLKPASPRKLQTAKILKISSLLAVPYFIVGQSLATDIVCSSILAHLTIKSSHPLVMAFVGPPGHGKTELAKRMGELLSANIFTADCTEMRHETDLFGPKFPYSGWGNGSPLNNFLSNEQGKRSVVFLDEFDKTTADVRQALLTTFDDGKYKDRRKSSHVYDCNKTIWILATNLGERAIYRFSESAHSRSGKPSSTDVTRLEAEIRNFFLEKFDGPLTGRISRIVPFLQFRSEEQAVMAHQFILRLATELRPPICHGEQRLMGHIDLKVGLYPADGDAPVCKLLAESYNPKTGARSLEQKVEQCVKMALTDAFLQGNEIFEDEVNSGPRMGYSIDHCGTANQDNRAIVIRPLASENVDPDSHLVSSDSTSLIKSTTFDWT